MVSPDEQAWPPRYTTADGDRVAGAARARIGAGSPGAPPSAAQRAAGDRVTAAGGFTGGPGAVPAPGAPPRVERMYPIPVDPGVFSWLDADESTRAAALQRLDRFVEWLCATFAMNDVLTGCWRRHPAVVAELWALERYFVAAHVEGDNKAEPARWLNQLAVTRGRLGSDWRAHGCEYSHQERVAEAEARVATRREQYLTDYAMEPTQVEAKQEPWRRWAWPHTDESGARILAPEHVLAADRSHAAAARTAGRKARAGVGTGTTP